MRNNRISGNRRIDRQQPVTFTFDGQRFQGFKGDTLAAALLANGVHLVARGFKYHRPRGIYTAGVEEPNALVELVSDGKLEPNTRATAIEIFDGMTARSQNNWPSLKFDMMAVNGLLSPVFTAGFYYKTFMYPASWWMFYEKFIRKAAGMGRATVEHDPDEYEKAHAFCDVAVIGAGPAGLEAALAAADDGAKVLLIEQDYELGGGLLSEDDDDASIWLDEKRQAVDASGDITVMTRTTAYGIYDHNVVGLVERVTDHLPNMAHYIPKQRSWIVRAQRIVMTTGAIERPFVFGNNDLPGIMLASAVKTYVNRFAVRPGREMVIFTNNDSPYAMLADLTNAGVKIKAVVDARDQVGTRLQELAQAAGTNILTGHVVTSANGRQHVRSVTVHEYDKDHDEVTGNAIKINCDLLALSAGWSPVVHLHSHTGAKPIYQKSLAAFVPGASLTDTHYCAGAMVGHWKFENTANSGAEAGKAAGAGMSPGDTAAPATDTLNIEPMWEVPGPAGKNLKKFVDLQHDVCSTDVEQAHLEGYVSIEHMKRYTTMGMATDQGKMSNINALAIMADQRRTEIQKVGTTTFRPPFTPVSFGALAGRERDKHFQPTRLSPIHDAHVAVNATQTTAGAWLRAWYYPHPKHNDEIQADITRQATASNTQRGRLEAMMSGRFEANNVRQSVGMVDVSSLGKIDIQGPDAAEFLNRVYVNAWLKLPVGKARYGVMLREDGFVLDDGTASRISEYRFFMTTTTAKAGSVMTYLEYLLETVWSDLRVHVISVTEQWAGMALAGPKSRDLLASAITDIDFSNEAFPFMGVRHGTLDGYPVRVCRISFSGEMAYEVYTGANYGYFVWNLLRQAGEPFNLVLYGLEALGVLRIEKGHAAGPELDNRVTIGDIGLAKMASKKKPYMGQVLSMREGMLRADRPTMIGFIPKQRDKALKAGSIVFTDGAAHDGHGDGHVSSVAYSPALACQLGLGFIRNGAERIGETAYIVSPVDSETIEVDVVSPLFFDPKGERVHA